MIKCMAAAGFSVLSAASFAQGWSDDCFDPENTQHYSDDYAGVGVIRSDFIGINMGVSGTVNWGPTACAGWAGGTQNAIGRYGIFTTGPGSVQTAFDDNGFALTYGAPGSIAGDFCYSRVIRYSDVNAADNTKSFMFGEDGGFRSVYRGLSNRYFIATAVDGGCFAELRCEVLGDAIRWRWKLTNQSATSMNMGIRFQTQPAQTGLTGPAIDAASGTGEFNVAGGKAQSIPGEVGTYFGYNMTGTTRPLLDGRAWKFGQTDFPKYIKFMAGQTNNYGIRYELGPTDEFKDASQTAHVMVDSYRLHSHYMVPRVFNDPDGSDPVVGLNPGPIRARTDLDLGPPFLIQTLQPRAVSAGQSTVFVHYARMPWSVGDYARPNDPDNPNNQDPNAYSVFLDPPNLVRTAEPSDDPATVMNGLAPNPFLVGVHIDNYLAELDKTVTLKNTRVKISFPTGYGLSLVAGESNEKVIDTIFPRAIGSTSFRVQSDGTFVGTAKYTIEVQPTPGPKKVLTGSIIISATPTMALPEGATMVTLPWSFNDTSLDKVLGMQAGIDYVAYKWNPDIGQYVPVTSVERGQAIWIVPTSDFGRVTLNGAQIPVGNAVGGEITNLRPGWNQIGNPYSYPIPLAHLTGVSEDNPGSAMTWNEMTDSQLLTPSLAYWLRDPANPSTGSYAFTQSSDDYMLPGVGYWVYVSSFKPIRLVWPPVFIDGIPGSDRSTSGTRVWNQSEKQWRVNLVARTNSGVDTGTYVGVVPNTADIKKYRLLAPPSPKDRKVQVSVVETKDGKPTRVAQSVVERGIRNEWSVNVQSNEAGPVTITWPNVNSVPRNVRLQVVDAATNTVRDLRYSSSYTFNMDQPGTRELKIQMEPNVATKALIGNVLVNRPTRDPQAPFAITYSLSAGANTSIRILGAAGKEVYTVTRGRADNSGSNSATWAMRDNANRAVAPGVYQVEIVAETQTGERVRKIVPINVVR